MTGSRVRTRESEKCLRSARRTSNAFFVFALIALALSLIAFFGGLQDHVDPAFEFACAGGVFLSAAIGIASIAVDYVIQAIRNQAEEVRANMRE